MTVSGFIHNIPKENLTFIRLNFRHVFSGFRISLSAATALLLSAHRINLPSIQEGMTNLSSWYPLQTPNDHFLRPAIYEHLKKAIKKDETSSHLINSTMKCFVYMRN